MSNYKFQYTVKVSWKSTAGIPTNRSIQVKADNDSEAKKQAIAIVVGSKDYKNVSATITGRKPL